MIQSLFSRIAAPLFATFTLSFACLAFAPGAYAQETKLNFDCKINIDGKTVSSPKVVIADGKTGKVSVDNQVEIELTPKLDGDTANVAYNITLTLSGGKTAKSSGTLKMKLGEETAFGIENEAGQDVEVVMKASKG